MKDRIRQLMEAQHMNQQNFAQFLGMAPATLSSILSERTKPTLNTIEAIKNKFPNINIDWLMFGNGSMFLDENPGNSSSSTPQEGLAGEQMLDFGDMDAADPAATAHGVKDNQGYNPKPYSQTQARAAVRTDVVFKEREPRKITEIRVFYDDQTWESFVPKK